MSLIIINQFTFWRLSTNHEPIFLVPASILLYF
ncbi:hypothetical protein POPTR_001G348651v4 [Populus trichocarpa]|uniref:Uncharacterized protein n=1 Tax=Populus trichocarpa TaxID=3694 RepID=A0A3N7EDJ9_POPTR|nr:hypothetical protein BDE02_01G310200 [Populus trichocarpa]RQO85697.1 hypothetical protein POPTR_001G348651v4 [Populus trichocarpa]